MNHASLAAAVKTGIASPLGCSRTVIVTGALALGLFILTALRPETLLIAPHQAALLHLVMEYLSSATGLMIFTVGWFAFSHGRGTRVQVLACAFLAVALLDAVHILAYAANPGPALPAAVEKPIHFWLSARIISALALLAVAALPPMAVLTPRTRGWLLVATLILIGVVMAPSLACPDWLAASTFVKGVSTVKIGAGYAVMLLDTVTLLLLLRDWRVARDDFRCWMIAGVWLLLLGEIDLTRFVVTTEAHHLLGHLYRTGGVGFIFWAIYSQALEEPHARLRQSQQRLARSEGEARTLWQEYQSLLDGLFVGICFVRDRHFIRVNRYAETLFGYAHGELDGRSTELIYPDRAAYLALGQRTYPAINRGEVFAAEVELVHRDGSRFWCLMRAQAMDPGRPLDGIVWVLEDARERRAARQALEQAAELYRAIFESRDVIKVLVDPHSGQVLDANQAAAAFYGEPREALRQRRAWEFSTTPREVYTEVFARILAGNADLTGARRAWHRGANGSLCEVEVYLDLIHRDGHVLLLATVLDLTARKAAEAALRDSEERYRSALVALAEGVAVYNRAGALITANPAAERILGVSSAELWERQVDDGSWWIIRADGTPLRSDDWPTVVTLKTGIAQRNVEMGIIGSDEQVTWLLVSTEPIRDTVNGEMQAVAVSFIDITAQKTNEAALQRSEARFRTLFMASQLTMLLIDPDTGAIVDANTAASDYYGYSIEQLRTMQVSAINPMPPEQIAEKLRLATRTRQVRFTHQHRLANGALRDVEIYSGPLELDGHTRLLASVHDITAQKAAEAAERVSLAALQRHDAQMMALNRMNELLLSCETRAEAYAIIARAAGRLFTDCTGALAEIDAGHAEQLRVVATWGDADALPNIFALDDCWAMRRGEVQEATARPPIAQCRHFAGLAPATYLCIPLTVRGETFGLLHLSADATQTDTPFADIRSLARAFSESIKLSLSNIALQETLREQAIRDGLTGLFNRRYLDETLPRELQRSQRRGEPLATAMLDLDHFKRFNDSYGHEAGDAVLRAIGALLQQSLRAGDLACRYGGEELALVMPGAGLDDARALLERLRATIMQLRVQYHGGDLPPITVSIGFSIAGTQELDADALLARADAALYRAKAAGRNRVVAADPSVHGTASAEANGH